MSWAEYKKKREEQENMETSYSRENNDSNNETSSWQKYKQKREEQKVQQTETLPVANKANTAPKTTTNLTEADLRKIEQNSGLETGTLNLNKMQAQQQKFENLQQKGNEILQDKNNKIYDVDYIYSDLGIDNGKVFKKSSAFKDGYDFGDITKTVLDTGATLGTEVTKGVANIGENIGDLASYGIAGVADLLGEDEYADKVRKNAQVSLVDKYTKPLSSKIDKNSILGSKGKEMAQSLGYVAGTAAIGTATGGTAGILGKTAEGAAKAANIATTATTFASSMGSGVTEAYQNGATDQEALAYGIISGIGEAGSELMFGGLGKVFGKVGFNPTGGALDEVIVQGLSRNIKNKMVKTLVQSGLMATGEGIEEVVSGVVSAIGKKATFMKEEDLKNILKDENLAEQFWMGTLTSVIAQAPSTISSIKNKTDYLTGEKWETTQKNKTPELPQNVQNNIEQQTIQTDTKTTQNQNMSQISDTNENNLKNTAINEINNSKISEQAKKDMLNAINSMENVDEESYNNIKQTLNEINKNELQTNSTYQDNLERRKNYVKYKDDINTYDNSAVEEVLSIIPTNRNGKRTVNQWLQVADEIGKRISGKSNAEIQEIAYKSWFENQPTKNITQYDSARKTSIGFQKLNSDMWVNKINEAVLKERTRLENTTNSQQVNLNNTQTNQESPIEDILNNKVDNNLETLYNNTKIGETTIIPVKTILSIQNSEGGYRTETQINNLKKDIEKNGITTPIEIYRKNNGTFAIENGNHRLKIAQELGIKDIPVKMVESWENIGVSTKNATKDFTQEYGGVYDDRITEKNSNIDEGRWNRERSRSGNNNQFGDSGRTRRNAELYETKSYSNEQTSINESKRNNSEQLKNPEKGSSSIGTRTNMQDILVSKATNNNKERVRDILSRNGSFSEQVDKYIADKLPSGDFLYLGETPTVLQNLGLPNNEVILKQSKLKNLMQESNNNTDKLHELPIETIKKIPEAIANPLNILQSSTDENSVVIITDLADANERPIIASIEVNYDGQIGNIDFLSNRLTSAYGKNNYDRFMKTEIAKGNLLYDIDEGIIKELPATRLQSPKGISSFVDTNNNASTINNSISQNNDSVKSNTIITNNYAQQTQNDTQNNQNVAPSVANNSLPVGEYTRKKTMNPIEIANLKPQDASTTPTLEQKNYKKGNKQSSFLSNIITDSKFLNEDLRQEMSKEDSIKYYEGITNKGTLESAYNKLQKNGQEEVIKWHTKDSKNATAEDVATGWILLKQYQDNGDYQSAVEVAKKMRDIGTTAGQTVQAYNILSRLTPEGMFYYAQSELDEAYNRMVEGKSKKWIEENQSKFNLTPEETQSILDIMKDVSTMEDGYNKKVKLAEIQKIITDKIPPTAGQSIKAWMRISMLFNPKTQVRNVMGNAVITPVNMLSDSISAGIDKIISKKTGVRTTGRGKIVNKNYLKGFGKGLYQSYNDFKKGINTRDIEGNRFEISEGKSFKNKGIGKALNRVDNLLSFMLDVGDRGFYEATFTNSINNQMLLNKVDAPTQEMIDIATTEALQRTWQDNNKYTQSVLKIRNILNNANIKGYGLGDVLIPFAKTPANLTKAIVDYSPAGLVKTLATDARILKNSLENGQYTAQVQHRFVQNLGKGMAGTFLYVLSYGLAKAGIATGESDDDKDVKNFMKNSLGISSYSIKIGDKTFSYDWAQPVATPLAIMTNYVKYSKENPDANILEKGINAMNIGTEQLLQQSFMESLNTVLNGNGTTLENLSQAILDLPVRAIPTFSRQIADMVDGTQRTTFEYGRPIKSAINSVVAKIPVVSKTLPASVNTLGNEIQKYGGNNNLWNVMLNPANTNKGHLSKAGGEIYNIYKETGDKTIFPRTAPYYINNKNEKVTMTAEQRNKFQTISGKYVESSLTNLLRDKEYQKLSSEEKANIINEIVSDSYSKAKYDVLNIDSKEYEKLRNTLKNVSASSYYNYKFKTKDMKKDCEKIKVLATSDYDNKEKTALYEQYILSTEDKKYPIVKTTNIDIIQYLQYKLADANGKFDSDKKDNGTVKGKSIRGSGDQKRWQYIENMNITYTQKLILYGLECTPSNKEQTQIVNYINSLPKTQQEKLEMLSKFQGFTIYKDGTFKY